MKPTVLVYNLSGERAKKVKWLAMRNTILYRPVQKHEYEHLIGDLVAGELPERPAYEGDGFQDEMLVLAHFPHPLVNRFLDAFRQTGVPSVKLKAMLTDTNSQWTSLALNKELQQEAEMFRQMKQFAHEKKLKEQQETTDAPAYNA